MKLRRLCKSGDSRTEGDGPAMYLADDSSVMVSQGKILDAETAGALRDVAIDEHGVAIPTETVLRAAAMVLAEHGRSAMLAEVADFLSARPWADR